MMKNKEETSNTKEKQPYDSPKLIEHGDLISITQGNALGENLDGGFTTEGPVGRGKKKPKKNRFS
ncbi:MAG TPA: hypothetical protein VIB00_10995 [Pyrinomonadaceae bacterium]|jgi:hypothetical protein